MSASEALLNLKLAQLSRLHKKAVAERNDFEVKISRKNNIIRELTIELEAYRASFPLLSESQPQAIASDIQQPVSATTEEIQCIIRELIRIRAHNLKLTRAEVAARMGVVKSHMDALEQGRLEPRITTLAKYARAVGYNLRLSLEQ